MMDIFDITSFTDTELNQLLAVVNTEKQRREAEKLLEAEKAFYEAARALYSIDPWYTFPISASDLEEEDELLLELLLQKIKKS